MKKETRFLLGVLVIVFGILLLLEQTSIISQFSSILGEILTRFWPLVLIFFGTKLLISKTYIPGIILFIIGLALLSSNLFSWDFFGVLWPLILIVIGMSILIRKEEFVEKGKEDEKESKDAKESKDSFLSETVVFWGTGKKMESKEFKGGEINVAFGDYELDLREAEISKKGAKIHLNCAFGDVDIFVPKKCRVKTSGSIFLGEWEPEIKERDVTEPVLEITGSVLFGSAKVRD
jgi:predicted membrane protein